MKILHSGSLGIQSGGPALSLYLTVKGLNDAGERAEVIMSPLREKDKLIANNMTIHYTAMMRNVRLGYMPGLKEMLDKLSVYDLYHVHGLWQYLGHGVTSYARRHGKPYIMTLRGMLYPQALAHSALVKKASLILYQRNDLQKAACIQATCIEEMEHYRTLGFCNPVAVLPNPIDINHVVDRPIPDKPQMRIGYLGRIHPRKRIEKLIYAMNDSRDKTSNLHLAIIGSGDNVYERFLHNEVKRLNLSNVKFTGFLSGKEKDEIMTQLSLLVVPSDFENFGNIVTEALVRGVPVIASRGMPWRELETHHCGWWIDNDQESITNTLIEAISLTEEERIYMGMNGKQLMRENYSVEVLAGKMKHLYQWILGQASKPEFVYE
ncbi:MAG: glycosyltransferase [Prevotella sp.]|jgi:glycosyltransferase involved in cell wall biosynthesis|nr:glycosyltransferase [Prevotella sp.]